MGCFRHRLTGIGGERVEADPRTPPYKLIEDQPGGGKHHRHQHCCGVDIPYIAVPTMARVCDGTVRGGLGSQVDQHGCRTCGPPRSCTMRDGSEWSDYLQSIRGKRGTRVEPDLLCAPS